VRDSPPNEPSHESAAWRRWSAVEPILDAALDLSHNERPAYVKKATGDDLELRGAVETLLAAADRSGDLTPGAVAVFPQLAAELTPEPPLVAQQIGPYRIVGQAGEGGMGIVYVAERADDQYHSRVALKLMRIGIRDPALIRRFLNERQILASLVHPGVARLYDGGVTADGRPWFAMELVEGTPISHFCDTKRLSVEQRLRVMLSACDAVAYAHKKSVIHRDLKPANILVDADGWLRLVDFGIAKVLEATSATPGVASVPALTPGYASPELIAGSQATAASDVYSLGVILYRLLTGRRPYRLHPRENESAAVAEAQYVAPSTMALRADPVMLLARRDSAATLRRRLRGDLDAIIAKAIARDPLRRYSSVDEFAADIRRHVEHRPVSVRSTTWVYRGAKFVRRNPIAALAIAISIVLVSVFAFFAYARPFR
jgi:serine/threonine protein kinase